MDEIALQNQFTEETLIEDLLTKIELPVATKARLKRTLDKLMEHADEAKKHGIDSERLKFILTKGGSLVIGGIGEKSYFELCNILMEMGIDTEDCSIFDIYRYKMLSQEKSEDIPKEFYLSKKQADYIPDVILIKILKDLYTFKEFYRQAWKNSDTLGKNLIISCVKKLRKEYDIRDI